MIDVLSGSVSVDEPFTSASQSGSASQKLHQKVLVNRSQLRKWAKELVCWGSQGQGSMSCSEVEFDNCGPCNASRELLALADQPSTNCKHAWRSTQEPCPFCKASPAPANRTLEKLASPKKTERKT